MSNDWSDRTAAVLTPSLAEEIHDPVRSDFIDDLVATMKLKSFLTSRGIKIPTETSESLAILADRYSREITEYVEITRPVNIKYK